MNKLRVIIEGIEDWLSGFLIVGALLVLFIGVVFRYALGIPTTWQDEVARYMMVWGALIGASVGLRDNSHIRVEILYKVFPAKMQKWVNIFANLVVILFFMFLIFYGMDLIEKKWISGQKSMTGIPLWFIYIIIPLTGVILSLRTVERLIRLISGKKESEHDENEGIAI